MVSLGDTVIENANEGTDTVQSDVSWTLDANLENLTLTGAAVVDGRGSALNNVLTGNSAANVLTGRAGNDTLRGGLGNDTYLINRGDGKDIVSENDSTADNLDTLLYGATINPLDLILSRQANDLRLSVYGASDQVTIQNWYLGASTQTEVIQAGNGQQLLNTQVNQLIQAMAGFTQQTGLSWDQAIAQRPPGRATDSCRQLALEQCLRPADEAGRSDPSTPLLSFLRIATRLHSRFVEKFSITCLIVLSIFRTQAPLTKEVQPLWNGRAGIRWYSQNIHARQAISIIIAPPCQRMLGGLRCRNERFSPSPCGC